MPRHYWVEEDQFAAVLGDILDGIADGSEEAVFKLVHDAVREGRDEWRRNAAEQNAITHDGNWRYGKHVTYRTLRKGGSVEGHIFSKKPGLPHLLEKGHAKSGGGRTRAFPHVRPAADYAFRYVREHLGEYLAKELS